jgi:AraC-like DNA-binding protein
MSVLQLATWYAGAGDHARIEPLYQGPLVSLGTFWCDPDDVRWRVENYVGDIAHIMFPSTSVRFAFERADPVLAGPNHAVFFNAGAVFRRERFQGQGDRNHFMVLDQGLLEELLYEVTGSSVARRFPRSVGHLPARAFLAERRFSLRLAEEADGLHADERLIELARATLRGAFGAAPAALGRRGSAALVEEAKALLSARYAERLTLQDIGRALNVSPFHLARAFRTHTGYSLHEYRTQLRLRTAVDHIVGGADDLKAVAAKVGFSSHSHLTTTFRRAFGVPPSALRA